MESRRSVTVLAVLATVLLAAVVFPLWKPLLVAAVLAGALSPRHERLAGALASRRTLSAALFTLGAVLILLIPLSVLAVVLVKQAVSLIAIIRHATSHHDWHGLTPPLPPRLERWADHVLEDWSNQRGPFQAGTFDSSRIKWTLAVAAGMVGSVAQAVFTVVIMVMALFFLLRDGHALIDWADRGSMMRPGQLRALLSELRRVSVSVIGAQLASGLIQTVVATIGYAMSGLPGPILLGALTLPASLIPTPGIAIVGLPLAALLWLMGRTGWAIFLAAWTTLFVGLVDYIVRPALVRGRTGLHVALILFSLLGGLLAFGFIGLIVGPLALALFLSVDNIRRREHAGVDPDPVDAHGIDIPTGKRRRR